MLLMNNKNSTARSMYVVTKSGREAWETQDAAVPEQYRLFLWLIDVQGEKGAVAVLGKRHPERLIRDWLKELAELSYIELRPQADDTTFPLKVNELAVKAGAGAVAALSSTGAYLAVKAHDENRRAKAPQQTTVLIVQDDPDQVALADLRVSMAGYQVRVATSVADLMKSLLNEGAPDLLLLDAKLPDGNGFEVLAKLRRHPKFASLSIVMLTMARDPLDIGRGLALGANGYVTKPYSKNILLQVIGGVFR